MGEGLMSVNPPQPILSSNALYMCTVQKVCLSEQLNAVSLLLTETVNEVLK